MIPLWAGLAIALCLIIGNVVALTFNQTLNQEDIAYQPPTWVPLQRLLYHPASTQVSFYDGASSGAGLFDLWEQAQTPEEVDTFRIKSEPVYTAVIDQPYRYTLKLENSPKEWSLVLLEAPWGMNVKDQQVNWVPKKEQTGRHQVEILAQSAEGYGSVQKFELIVSEMAHPFGTEMRGRDLFASLILGCRWSLLPGLVAVSVSLLFGLWIGGYAGYYGQRLDALLSSSMQLTTALPALVLLFLTAVIFRSNIYAVMAMLGFLQFPKVAMAVKQKVLVMKSQQFIEAARELGLSDRTILWKEIIWANMRPMLLILISYGFAFAILIEVSLSYLKLGIQTPMVSWGNLLFEGKDRILYQEYWPVVLPSLAILFSVTGFYLLGDSINRILGRRSTL